MNYSKPRLPYAAQELQKEIATWDEDAQFEGDAVDGLGVYRSLRVTTARADALFDLIERLVDFDKRLGRVEQNGDEVSVTFVYTARAEIRTPFGIAHLSAAVEEVDDPVVEEVTEDEPAETPPPAKKTAKKAAKKAAPEE